jgi:hypothetical protein
VETTTEETATEVMTGETIIKEMIKTKTTIMGVIMVTIKIKGISNIEL